MLKVYAGQDSYASFYAALDYAHDLAAQHDWDVVILDADDLRDLSQIWQLLFAQSLFSSGAVVLAKRLAQNASLSKEVAEKWEQLASRPLVMWEDGDLDQRNKLSKLVAGESRATVFNIPEESELVRWLGQQAAEFSIKLDKRLAQKLVEQLGSDKWRLHNEIVKLCLLAAARRVAPTEELWIEVGSVDVEGNIWQFLDSLSLGDRQRAVQQFQMLMSHEDLGQYLITMLARELDLLTSVLAVQEQGGNLEDLKLKPYVLKQSVRKSKRFTLTKLQKLTHALLRLDLSIKQGKVDEYTGLGLYILSW